MVDPTLKHKEQELERLKVDEEIAGTKSSIAQRKAAEAAAKKTHGRDWKKMMGGAFRSIRPNREAIHDMYSVNPDLRDLSKPKMVRRG